MFVTLYNIMTGRNNQKYQLDVAEKPRNWLHPADIVSVNNIKEDSAESFWQINTDGFKREQGVGSEIAVFTGRYLRNSLK